MKFSILKKTAAFAIICVMAISCNNKTTQDGIESDIENPATSQDSVTSNQQSQNNVDSTSIKINDASRMSNGKDSVTGEVTPPNAKEQ